MSEPSLNDDKPLENPDEDGLGHAPFALAVANSIKSQPSRRGFVYAIHGPWGSGKTTALNFVVSYLSDEIDAGHMHIVRFNPWWIAAQEDLTRAFFDDLIAVIGPALDDKAKKVLSGFASRVSKASPFLKIGMDVVPFLKDIPDEYKEKVLETIGAAGDITNQDKSIHNMKQDVEEALRGKNFRTLVIIDDIDRLTADEQLQIFKLVKTVADLPNIIYLLVFDEQRAMAALKAKPEFGGDVNFLEKIVQAPFDLPMPSVYSLTNWFCNDLETITEHRSVNDRSRWHRCYKAIVEPLLVTPRAVVKLLNGILVQWGAVAGDVDVTDLVAVEALRLFDKNVYQVIVDNRDRLTGESSPLGSKKEQWATDILKPLSPKRRDQATGTLALLFPRFATGSGQSYLSNFEDALKHKRICTRENIDSYFRFAVDDGTVSASERAAFLASLGDPDEARRTLVALQVKTLPDLHSKAFRLVVELRAHVEELDVATSKGVFKFFMSVGDMPFSENDFVERQFGFGIEGELRFFFAACLRNLLNEQRFELVKECLQPDYPLQAGRMLLEYLRGEHLRGVTYSIVEPGDELVIESELDGIEALVLKRIEEAAVAETILDIPMTYRIYWLWEALAGKEAVETWMATVAEKDEKCILLAETLIRHHRSSNRGLYDVVGQDAKEWIDVVNLVARVNVLRDDPGTSDEQKVKAGRFLAAYKESNKAGD